jgi:hypothetical protein
VHRVRGGGIARGTAAEHRPAYQVHVAAHLGGRAPKFAKKPEVLLFEHLSERSAARRRSSNWRARPVPPEIAGNFRTCSRSPAVASRRAVRASRRRGRKSPGSASAATQDSISTRAGHRPPRAPSRLRRLHWHLHRTRKGFAARVDWAFLHFRDRTRRSSVAALVASPVRLAYAATG